MEARVTCSVLWMDSTSNHIVRSEGCDAGAQLLGGLADIAVLGSLHHYKSTPLNHLEYVLGAAYEAYIHIMDQKPVWKGKRSPKWSDV
jgi:hypothetical protein